MRLFFFIFLSLFAIPAWATPESQINSLVESAPEIRSESELPKLVKHLTRELRQDEDKAYALLVWIVKNIDYDDYKKKSN